MKEQFHFLLVLTCVTLVFTYNSCQKDAANASGCGSTTTVTDIDGNIYNVVEIGSQCWMKENLKTAHYRDGSAITEMEDSVTWAHNYMTGAQTPAWCYYNSDSANNAIYGKLYNWYAVDDQRNICPTGWHIPTEDEFKQLTDYLGGESVAGGKMKSITLWSTPNSGANNSSGFTALPAGFRASGSYAAFGFIGMYCDFWASTESSGSDARIRGLAYNSSNATGGNFNKPLGLPVRCIKD